MQPTASTHLTPALTAVVAATLLDQFTKWLILEVVMQPPQVIPIVPFFNLTLGYNTGISFGLLQSVFEDNPWVLTSLTLTIVGFLLLWARRAGSRREAIALGLISGGALGNAIDRIRQGAVTDFLDVYVGTWHWPTFNMADVAIFLGAATLVVGDLFGRNRPAAPASS
ncbi:signal peptidase II [Microvirga splendida]|uniref:Lipoprotein signal peptidase n=1 Tax=Microvirga splendida TaxID=2795727 RepID=A0ABS0Y3T4_9HYPH|nr:signal peptidase II [Microvirga splendida]MBJ6126969.1 signal peptidase II [Microvirga splendida]